MLILDFYHAASYLEKLAKALHPNDEKASTSQAEQWCSLLKAEGGALLLAALQEWDWPARKSPGLKEQLKAVQDYFGNNVHRMEYPEDLAEGWQIGSGVIESACKTVVGQRLKGARTRRPSWATRLRSTRSWSRSTATEWVSRRSRKSLWPVRKSARVC